jgi:hypothetical protein
MANPAYLLCKEMAPAETSRSFSCLLSASLQIWVHQSFAAPHADDRDHDIVTAIDDPIRAHLEFAKPWRT